MQKTIKLEIKLKTCAGHPVMPSYGSLCCDQVAEALERALDAAPTGSATSSARTSPRTTHEQRSRIGAAVWLLRYRSDDMVHSVSEREIRRATKDLTKAAIRYSSVSFGALGKDALARGKLAK